MKSSPAHTSTTVVVALAVTAEFDVTATEAAVVATAPDVTVLQDVEKQALAYRSGSRKKHNSKSCNSFGNSSPA